VWLFSFNPHTTVSLDPTKFQTSLKKGWIDRYLKAEREIHFVIPVSAAVAPVTSCGFQTPSGLSHTFNVLLLMTQTTEDEKEGWDDGYKKCLEVWPLLLEEK